MGRHGEVRIVQEAVSALPAEMIGNSIFVNTTTVSLNEQVPTIEVQSSPMMSSWLGLSG